MVPVLVGSAALNRGVVQLLDAIVDLLPSAAEVRTTGMLNGSEVEVAPVDGGPTVALAFKTVADPHVGRVTYLRVYSGSIKSNTHAWNATRGEDERLGQLFFARGKEHINTDVIGTGDIGAVAKLGSVMTGDTLCDQGKPIALAGVDFLARRTRPRSIPRPRPTSTRWDRRCNGWSRKIRRCGSPVTRAAARRSSPDSASRT